MPKLTQDDVEQWIAETTGKFLYTKILDGQVSPELYSQLRNILKRLRAKGIVAPVNGQDGWWRAVDKSAEEIRWWDLDGEIGENLLLPLGLNKYCFIPRPSVVLCAGKYNTGKTAFCINVVYLNIDKWANNINFYVSEGAEMLQQKFKSLNTFIPKPPPFKVWRRTENFADVIDPEALSVIDYLRVDMDKPYTVGSDLFHIFNKLTSGIAVVAMQKPPGRKLAFGGASTAFEPILYVSMDNGYLQLEKVKIPRILDRDPYQLKIEFKIGSGVNFYDIVENYEGGF